MKALIQSAIVTVAIVISTLSCHAQCNTLQAQSVSCTGSNNCSQTVAVNQAVGSLYGWYVGSFPVYCCDYAIYSYTEQASCDGGDGALRIPARALAQVASLQPLLIRNCARRYDPYVAQPADAFDVQKSLKSHSQIAFN
jgi:hypothetical protein